jgi:peptidoglycan hydrolase-like protein with peptidoglycan-binding domain
MPYRSRLAIVLASSTILGLGLAPALLPAAFPPALAQDTVAPTGVAPETLRAYVAGIQRALAEHGFYNGAADGVAGSATTRAIRAYQQKAGLPVDGEPSKSLLDHITFSQPPIRATAAVPPTAAYSSPARPAANPLIEEIQAMLAERGYRPGPTDGIAGGRTSDAIRAYQKDAGLPETGIADQALLDALNQAKAGAAAPQ